MALDENQKEAVRRIVEKLTTNHGVLLCMPTGAGKTRTALQAVKQAFPASPVLMVVLPSTLSQWQSEISLIAPDVQHIIFHGIPPQRRQAVVSSFHMKPCWVLTSITMLRNTITEIEKVRWGVVIVDEIHLYRNPMTKGYQALRRLPIIKLGLSATPCIGSAHNDLQAHLGTIDPTRVQSNSMEILRKHVVSFDRDELGIRKIPVVHRSFYVSFFPEELVAYTTQLQLTNDALEMYRNILLTVGKHNRFHPELVRARNIYTCRLNELRIASVYWHLPAVLAEVSAKQSEAERVEVYRRSPLSAKLEAVLYYLPILHRQGMKVLVFSEYVVVLRVLLHHLPADVPCAILSGDMSVKARNAEVARWKDATQQCNILFLTKAVGGIGLNLEDAHHAIMLDTAWDPQKEEQSIGRMNRRTQKADKIKVMWFRVAGSFDAIRHTVHIGKKKHLEGVTGKRDWSELGDIPSIWSAVSSFQVVYGKWMQLLTPAYAEARVVPPLKKKRKRTAEDDEEKKTNNLIRNKYGKWFDTHKMSPLFRDHRRTAKLMDKIESRFYG